MSEAPLGRPQPSEYAEYFAGYVGKVPAIEIQDFLHRQLESALKLIGGLDESQGGFRYEPGKWTIKDLLGHVVDTERVFAYRALVFARNDVSALPGFDQDPWVQYSSYARLKLSEIAEEFDAVRRSTILLFRHLDPEAWDRRGVANNKNMTTRAAAFIIGGHAQHHLEILRERYLGK